MSIEKSIKKVKKSVDNVISIVKDKSKEIVKEKSNGRKFAYDAELLRLRAKKQLYEDILENPSRIVDTAGSFFDSPIQSTIMKGGKVAQYTMEASMIGFNNIPKLDKEEVKKVIAETEKEINKRIRKLSKA